jgi:vanillate O-demethylase ferredoxin subunit
MMAVEVRSRTALTEDIVALDLVPRSGTLPPFSPGAHIDVALPNGLVRQYSLTNPPDVRDCYQIAVLREPDGRGGSQCVQIGRASCRERVS